jgi:hypothetical protein
MPAKTSGSGAPAPKRATKRATRKSAPKPDHNHEHVEFRLSKKTASLIDAALKGLTTTQQERVLEAVDRVGEEAGETVGRWVEQNVVANANELLALMAPDLAGRGRWDDLRAIYTFLDHLDVTVDQGRLQKEVQKAKGTKVAAQFKKELGGKSRK